MHIPPTRNSMERIDAVLEEFESGWCADTDYLKQFAAREKVTDHLELLTELIRADIDRRYQAKLDVDLESYVEWFPSLWNDERALQAIGFEEFRARRSRGLSMSRRRWSWIPNLQDTDWFETWMQSSKKRDVALTQYEAEWDSDDHLEPTIGASFGDFQILSLLGVGALSRVFLAKQTSLAHRYVAIKVVRQPLDEPAHLARLQHTGIVPIFSLHRIGGYSVLCMPYSGSATLADWIGTEPNARPRSGQSLVDTVQLAKTKVGDPESSGNSRGQTGIPISPSEWDGVRVWNEGGAQPLRQLVEFDTHSCVLWLARRIAAALTHAHEREVVHGDIKPANVLLRNDGEPALIDFNLSKSVDTEAYHVGGTLPYMSPEQLQLLLGRKQHLTTQSDIYSMGAMLYQIVEGRLPFPSPLSSAEEDIFTAIQYRQKPVSIQNTKISVGLKRIIQKCLAFEPKNRYADGGQLLSDLDRESTNRPLLHANEPLLSSKLPKIARRFPRLFSVAPVMLIACLLLALIGSTAVYWRNASHYADAKSSMAEWRDTVGTHFATLLDPAAPDFHLAIDQLNTKAIQLVAMSPKTNKVNKFEWLPGSERTLCEAEFYDDLLGTTTLLASNHATLDTRSRAMVKVWCQHLMGLESAAISAAASRLNEILASNGNKRVDWDWIEDPRLWPNSEFGKLWRSQLLLQRQQHDLLREELTQFMPRRSLRALYWVTVGDAERALGHHEAAELAYGILIHEAVGVSLGYARRSQLYASGGLWKEAESDVSQLIQQFPKQAAFHAERARLREKLERYEDAVQDLDAAIRLNPAANRFYFFRSRLELRLGQDQKAQQDFQTGIRKEPGTSEDWVSRGLAHLPKDPAKALSDLKQAEKLAPFQFEVQQNLAHVYSEYFHDPAAAIAALDRLLENDPSREWARVDRCVLLARTQQIDRALSEVDVLLGQNRNALAPSTCYQLACVHALLSQQHPPSREEAFHFLSLAILRGYGGDLFEADKDLESLRGDAQLETLKHLVKWVRPATSEADLKSGDTPSTSHTNSTITPP